MSSTLPDLNLQPAMGPLPTRLPTDLDLPESDGRPMENYIELHQTNLLISAIRPVLDEIHPDGKYILSGNNGIYWKITDPPLNGCRAPDFAYIAGVTPMIGNRWRRSYVMWQEQVSPTLLIEYVSADGSEERDSTLQIGNYWVYEQAIKAQYYAIYFPETGEVELNELSPGRYRRVPANSRGHYPVPPERAELGIHPGTHGGQTWDCLRFFTPDGVLLPSGEDREAASRLQTEQERLHKEQAVAATERERLHKEQAMAAAKAAEADVEALRAKLRALGVDPDQV